MLFRSDGVLQIAIGNVGQNPWEVQLFQKGIQLEEGKTYEGGFTASSDEATKVKISVGHEAEDYSYTDYLSEGKYFELGTAPLKYVFRFTMNHASDQNAKLSFDMGMQDGAVPTTLSIDVCDLVAVQE